MTNTTPTKMALTSYKFELEVIDGEAAKSSTGMVDSRLFKGGNFLYIKKDIETNFWFYEYEQGILPYNLQQRFTNFSLAKKHADLYYAQRNLKLKEVDA